MGLGLFRRRGTLIRNYAIVEHNKKTSFDVLSQKTDRG